MSSLNLQRPVCHTNAHQLSFFPHGYTMEQFAIKAVALLHHLRAICLPLLRDGLGRS